MAAAERDRFTSAAWLRRARSGTFERPARTVSPTFRGEQHPGLQSDHVRAVLSFASPPNETRLHQAACDHDAEEFVARRVRFFARGRIYQWQVRGNSRFTRSWTGQQNETGNS